MGSGWASLEGSLRGVTQVGGRRKAMVMAMVALWKAMGKVGLRPREVWVTSSYGGEGESGARGGGGAATGAVSLSTCNQRTLM